MTSHQYANSLVHMQYYKFGRGSKNMFCFHGFGMHGKQFRVLEETLGNEYTFYGFDLFFHKGTILKDQSVAAVKKGITKSQLASLFSEFCENGQIDRFSIIAHSMGSYYATSLAEEMPERIDELVIGAPSSFKPGKIITFLSANKLGNKLLERLALSNSGLSRLLSTLKKTRVIDQKAYEVLLKEVASPELRFSLYACASYLRFLSLDTNKFIEKLNEHQIRSFFIFGERDRNYPVAIGRDLIPKLTSARQVVINENHYMINRNLADVLSGLLHDH